VSGVSFRLVKADGAARAGRLSTIHGEIDTPAFRAFLKKAAEAFVSRVKDAAGGVEGQMPWKKDGEKWHLGEKGFPAGVGVKWDRSLLPRVIKVMFEVTPIVWATA